MNAYELADIVDKWAYSESAEYLTDAANMLRQQADLIRNLQKTLGFLRSGYESINLTPQTNPLSDEEIETIYLKTLNKFEFARAIEERHGIK